MKTTLLAVTLLLAFTGMAYGQSEKNIYLVSSSVTDTTFSYDVSVDGRVTEVPATVLAGGSKMLLLDASMLTLRSHTIKVQARDAHGNPSGWTRTHYITNTQTCNTSKLKNGAQRVTCTNSVTFQ